jgi:hypothetical protein
VFHIVTGLLGLYVALRFVGPLPWPIVARVALSILIVLVSLHHLWTRLAFGTMFSPEAPRAVVIAANVIFGTTLLIAIAQCPPRTG